MTLLAPPRPLRASLWTLAALVALAASADAQTVRLSVSDNDIAEGGSTPVTATLSQDATADVTVTIGLAASSTTESGDVTFDPGTTITIPTGSRTGTTTLRANQDADPDDETAVVEITAVSGGGASEDGQQQVTVTIRDDDKAVVDLLTSATAITEGGQATITARLSRTTTAATTVTFSVAGDSDAYSLNPLSVTIPTGQTDGTATLRAAEDNDTSNETLVVSIASVTGGSGATENGQQAVTITVTDNDNEPRVTLTASPTTIAEDGGTSTLTARLNRVADNPTTVSFATTGDTDAFTLSSPSVTIPTGQTTGVVTLTARDDSDFNNDAIRVDISGVTGSNALEDGTQFVTVTITDDDLAPVSITANPLALNEGQESTLTVSLPSGTTAEGPITVALAYEIEDNDDDDTDGADRSDFTAPNQIIIPAGQSSATATFRAVEDDIFEENAEVTVSISGVTGRGAEDGDQEVVILITSDDVRPTVTLSAAPRVIGARGGTSTLTATLTNPSDQDVVVSLAYFGSASRGANYTAPDQITVEAGDLTGTGLLESTSGGSGRQVLVDVTSVLNAAEDGEQQEFISFNSDLDRVTVSFADATATVDEAAGSYTIRLVLSEALAAPATVTVSRTGGAADDLGGFAQRSVQIPAGATTATMSVPVTDDALREGDETFSFTLSTNDSDRVRVASGTFELTVTDNDDATTAVVNEIDALVGAGANRFVELLSAGGGGATDDLALTFYRADSTVIRSVSLDGLTTGTDGLLLIDAGSFDVPDAFRGVAVVRGDGPLRGSLFDDDDDVIDAVFFDEQATADTRNQLDGTDLEVSEGSLQRQANGEFAFAAPPTPGAANAVGAPTPTQTGPTAQRVGNVFPNPSAGRATVAFSVATPQRVRVSVYDALGREVAVAFDGDARPGAEIAVAVGADSFAPGVYVVRVVGAAFAETRRLTVAR